MKIKNNDGKRCFLYKNKVYKNRRKEKNIVTSSCMVTSRTIVKKILHLGNDKNTF